MCPLAVAWLCTDLWACDPMEITAKVDASTAYEADRGGARTGGVRGRPDPENLGTVHVATDSSIGKLATSGSSVPSSIAPEARRPIVSAVRRAGRRVPGPAVGLVAIVIAMSVLSPYFLTLNNLSNILTQISAIGVMAVGETLVIITGGIDLSVGSVLAVSMMVGAWMFADMHTPFVVAFIAVLLVGSACGLVNGLLSTFGRVQPFIATLATMFAAGGLALWITNGQPISGFPSWFSAINQSNIGGVFSIEDFLMFGVFVAAAFWLHFRPRGRALYAIGGNVEVARLSGLPIRSARIQAYVVAGLMAGLAGLLVGSQLATAQPTSGTGATDLLSVIAAVVIGGASLSGGVGKMSGTFIGLLIIGVISNGLSQLNVSPNLEPIVIGAVILVAVLTDRKRRVA